MSMKDPISDTTVHDAVKSASDPSGGTASEPRRSDAVGAEIPVVVHASRYSAGKGTGKASPVHEETRTVIVFPQGAVVRLAATMTVGEVVVLTNQQTGADVICRVANVKAQTRMQNYVNLEFTQRAPGFWGSVVPSAEAPARVQAPASSAKLVETPGPVVTRPAPVVAPLSTTPVPLQQTKPEAPETTGAARELAVVPVSQPVIPTPEPVAAPIAVAVPQQKPSEAPGVAFENKGTFGSGLGSGLSLGLPKSSGRTPKLSNASSELTPHASGSSSTKKLLITAVAVGVLAVGGISAKLLLRQNGSQVQMPQSATTAENVAAHNVPTEPTQTQADVVDPAPARQSSAQQAGTGRQALSASNGSIQQLTAASNERTYPVTAASEVVSTAPSPAAPAPKIAPAPPAAVPAHVPTALSGILSPIRPTAKGPASIGSTEAPPVIAPAADAAAAGSPGLLDTSRASAPAPPTPGEHRGGQIQAPKLISSPAPIYPTLARSQRLEGVVVIEVLVDAKGNVAAAKLIAGSALLQQAAIDAVRNWRYEPARLNGEAISTHTRVSVTFSLH